MSRSICISYEDASGKDFAIEILAPYDLLGTQQSSLKFWSIPRLKEVGIERLTILGESDPVNFRGWDDLADLGHEIELLAQYLPEIDFDADLKASWLANLTYCYHLLIATAPKDSRPCFDIG